MKRRNFLLNSLKTLFGISVLPNVVKARPDIIGTTERSMKIPVKSDESGGFLIRKDIMDKIRSTPEGATKYISGLYRKSCNKDDFMGLMTEMRHGHSNVSYTFTGYAISGEGKTREQAWERFWEDFAKQTSINHSFDSINEDTDIFWRRVVEENEPLIVQDNRFVAKGFSVSCRFSLGDFS